MIHKKYKLLTLLSRVMNELNITTPMGLRYKSSTTPYGLLV